MTLLWTYDSGTVYTIGHSNHALSHFVGLLAQYGIDVLADTRSQPRSQFAPHFNGDALRDSLAEHGVKYKLLGAELGGRPADTSLYDDAGHALYSEIAKTQAFEVGIALILQGRMRHRIALLCSEENPSVCHRRLLVARVLKDHGVPVVHIRGDGTHQTEDDLTRAETANHQLALFGDAEPNSWKSLLPILRRPRQRP